MTGKTKWMFEGRSYGKWENLGNVSSEPGSMSWKFTIFGKDMARILRIKQARRFLYVVRFMNSKDPLRSFNTLDDAKAYVQDHIGGYL